MPDLLLGGSAVTVEAGAVSGQSGQYAKLVKANGKLPSCQSASSTEQTFVPVAMAAKDWKVTPRRIRHLLTTGRLEGRQQVNGYWEVTYPYRYTFGARGCGLKRFQGKNGGRHD